MTLPRPGLVWVRRLAAATLALNVVLLVSGGVVRLTGSGLGCPTWPSCTSESLVTTPAMGIHGYIEFGNRLIGVVLEVVAVALVVAVFRARPKLPTTWRWLATVQALVVPAQAVIGGILVLTDLNPYVRTLHFLVSFPIMLAAAVLLRRTCDGVGPRTMIVGRTLRLLTTGLLVAASIAVVVGTFVTGTGPHAGDPRAERLPYDPEVLTRLHSGTAYLLLVAALAVAIVGRARQAPQRVQRGAVVTVALIVAQGVLGYIQYFTGVPPFLVGVHMLGSALLFVAAAWTHLSTTALAAGQDDRPSLEPAGLAEPLR